MGLEMNELSTLQSSYLSKNEVHSKSANKEDAMKIILSKGHSKIIVKTKILHKPNMI